MPYLCDKCGATTRWYDEKCPRCGATLTVEIPAPIALPNFASDASRRGEKAAVVSPSQPQTPQTRQATSLPTEETKTQDETTLPTEETKTKDKTSLPAEETKTQDETTLPTEETKTKDKTSLPTEETKTKDETSLPTEETKTKDKTTLPTEETKTKDKTSLPAEETKTKDETTLPAEETKTKDETSRRLNAFRRGLDAWRAAFDSETASVTVPRGRAARYALGVAVELLVCPPCALLAAYFFACALLADRRANYHAAMRNVEKARRTLAVGLGVFAASLCAFIFYVQSQEPSVPQGSSATGRLFKN